MLRRHLREIPASNGNVSNFGWSWDSNKASDLLCGMGVSPMEKDPQDLENTPQDQMIKMTPPHKRQNLKERDDVFVIARRPRQARALQPVISWDALPDELLLSILSYLHLTELLRVSRVCKRWHRLSSDESLWHSLDLCGKHLADGVVGKLLSMGVVVFRCPRSCIGEPIFKKTRPLRLQHVDLSNCTVSVDALHGILSRCHKLQNLSLEGLTLSDEIMHGIAKNSAMERLNLGGCSGFSPETLKEMLSNCTRVEELNLSWCDFTADHIKVTVNHIPSHITQLNFSGYRQNLEIPDLKSLLERCPKLTHLDLSDSVLLTSECFPMFQQLTHLQHLGLSRCYQISPANLLELGQATLPLKTLSVFGIVTDTSFQLLKESLPHIKINCSFFSTIGRPTTGHKRNREIWGMKCKLTLNRTDLF
ncbi:S-phase kinase-associated protein 2 [Bombina bombina]|uniref:S-phase kinase-associated protein 2 n=1 Tax=Bombina bombina TaxID=8345 RepID=UPI00235A8B63|nr:S-phase kinase-associated protein 2 [Bombina bombina]